MAKVLIDLRKMADPFSGLGQFSLALGRALHRRNHHLSLLFLIPEKQEDLWQDGSCIRPGELAAYRSDIALVHHLHQESDLKIPGVCNVLTVHDINFIYKYFYIKRNYKIWRFRHFLKGFDHVVCISRFTRSELTRVISASCENFSVILNGLNPLHHPSMPDILPVKPFFFSVGAFLRKKNLHSIIPMMQLLPDYQWIVAGPDEGSYARELKAAVRSLGLEQRILFTGSLTEAHKAWYYHHCEALFFPSTAEGFGLPVLEAFSAGKPVFCFPITALPEITGGHAFFWERDNPAEMAARVRTSLAEDREDLREARKQYARQFSWDHAADAYLALYASAMR